VELDLETTGLGRRDRIVSVGLLVDGEPHILFVRSRVIANISVEGLHEALGPLAIREDLVVVGHNIGFDLGMLWREGIGVAGTVHCTEKLLRLVDPDRNRNKDVLSARRDRRAAPGSPPELDYRLKHAVAQILGVRLIGFDDTTPMDVLPYRRHVLYLTSDLLGTRLLYDHLLGRLTPGLRDYHDRLVAPLTPILLEMGETGFRLDTDFIRRETRKLRRIMAAISEAHRGRHGVPLGLSQAETIAWLFGELGLVPRRFKKRTPRQILAGRPRGDPSLKSDHLELLAEIYAGHADAASSLSLIRRYRKAATFLVDLRKIEHHADHRDGRVHTVLRDTLATGRISSKGPNLQGVAKRKVVAGVPVRCRNALVASEGYELVSFDIEQADIRVEAHAVASFPVSAAEHLEALRQERLGRLGPRIGLHLDQLANHRNPAYHSPRRTVEPDFDPSAPCALAEILGRDEGDFYTEVARHVTSREDLTSKSPERKTFKTVTLGMVNSITPPGLARQLGYGDSDEAKARAKELMDAFWRAYPKVARFTDLIWWQIALTGQTETFAGRARISTPHRWMVSLPRVELLISFKGPEWYWLDVIPLRPGRHGLTAWIRRAWDATYRSSNLDKKIYEDVRGPLCTRDYRLFRVHPPLMYRLPVRNISWRSIRRVRTEGEEADYHGFDATARSLANHIFQGGTADVSKTMMIRALPYCRSVGARLLLQIHDELVFEVPEGRASEFVGAMRRILEQPPTPDFRVPIKVKPKRGRAFGEMEEPEKAPGVAPPPGPPTGPAPRPPAED
jgi:DNA polymerase I-like protein with 3'-5' exonuclease and polymerase domains